MCQMSIKLPTMFDQNPLHTFDKIVKKLITTKTLSKLTLGENVKVIAKISRYQPGEQKTCL